MILFSNITFLSKYCDFFSQLDFVCHNLKILKWFPKDSFFKYNKF